MIWVIIPAHNEEKTIANIVRGILRLGKYHCVVIDDGSEDGTCIKASEAGAIVLKHPFRLGAWQAIYTGFLYSYTRGAHIIVTMDADGQHLPTYISTLISPIEKNEADICVANYLDRLPLAGRLYVYLLKLFSGLSVADITSGFRAYNRKAISYILSLPLEILDYQDVGVLLSLKKGGFRFREVSIKMNNRIHGSSRVYPHFWSRIIYMFEAFLLGVSKR